MSAGCFRAWVVAPVAVGLVVACAAGASAQFRGGFRGNRGGFGAAIKPAPLAFPDRNFVVCRLMYTQVRREPSGGGWRTDYPYGEINLTIRLSELTKTPVSREGRREPNHYVVRMTDDSLFQCPFTIASDVGTVGFEMAEVEQLRQYLLKGGFLWVDDFWGSYAWEVWESEIRKVFSAAEYPIVDVSRDHPIFHTMFDLEGVPQIPGIGTFLAGRTSERGADSADVHVRAIADQDGRVMVFMTHNTDVSDSWEREGEDPTYFRQFSVDGYRVAINVLLYAMTH